MIYNEERSYTQEDLLLFIDKLRKENQQLKEERNTRACLVNDLQETLEEIREYIKEELKGLETTTDKITHCLSYQDLIDEYKSLLQIIDKGVK